MSLSGDRFFVALDTLTNYKYPPSSILTAKQSLGSTAELGLKAFSAATYESGVMSARGTTAGFACERRSSDDFHCRRTGRTDC